MFALLGSYSSLNEGIVLYLKHEESSGLVIDSSGNGYNGTNNGATLGVTGKIGNGISFSTNDYVTFGDNNAFSFGNGTTDSPFSIVGWIYMDSLASNNAVLSKYSNVTSGTGEWRLAILTTGKVNWSCIDNSTINVLGVTTNETLSTGSWIHICATYDGSGTEAGMKIYINGTEATYAGASVGSYVAMENTTTPLIQGAQLLNFTTPQYFDGDMDEIRIYSRELTASEALEDSLRTTPLL